MDDRLKAPLKLFVNELTTHFEFFNAISKHYPEDEPSREALRKKLESKFHLIKGSAGFFSLSQIVTLADKGERTMKEAKANPEKLYQFFTDELTPIIAGLQAEYQRLINE